MSGNSVQLIGPKPVSFLSPARPRSNSQEFNENTSPAPSPVSTPSSHNRASPSSSSRYSGVARLLYTPSPQGVRTTPYRALFSPPPSLNIRPALFKMFRNLETTSTMSPIIEGLASHGRSVTPPPERRVVLGELPVTRDNEPSLPLTRPVWNPRPLAQSYAYDRFIPVRDPLLRDDDYAAGPSSVPALSFHRNPRQQILVDEIDLPEEPSGVLPAKDMVNDVYRRIIDANDKFFAIAIQKTVTVKNSKNLENSKPVLVYDFSEKFLPHEEITSLKFYEEDRLMIGTSGANVYLLAIDGSVTGDPLSLSALKVETDTKIYSFACDRLKNTVYTGGSSNKLISFDPRTQVVYAPFQLKEGDVALNIAMDPQGRLIVGTLNHRVEIFDIRRGDVPVKVINEHHAGINGIAFMDNCFITGGGTGDGFLRMFDLTTFNRLQAYDTGAQITDLAYANKTLIVTQGYSTPGTLFIHLPKQGFSMIDAPTSFVPTKERALKVTTTPDGQKAFVASANKTVSYFFLQYPEKQPHWESIFSFFNTPHTIR